MHYRPEEFVEEETFTGELDALKAALAEAEDLLAEFAIEMRMRAKEVSLRAEQLSEELGERHAP
jgi:hypothetical protein